METPPLVSKKPNVSSLTKTSLTPCRRMGLSRRSSSLIKQIHQSVKSETTPVQSDSSEINVSSTTTPDAVVLTNTPTTTHPIVSVKEKKVTTILKVRRCLGTPVKENNSTSTEKQQENSSSLASLEVSKRKEDPHILKKRKLGHESCEDTYQETNVSKDSEKQNEMENATEPAADEVIRQVLMSIKEKKKMLDTLKVQETYAKKHNVDELKAQTARWKVAGQEALRYTVELARHAGYSVSIKQLMRQHDFPPHLISYNSDEDEFE